MPNEELKKYILTEKETAAITAAVASCQMTLLTDSDGMSTEILMHLMRGAKKVLTLQDALLEELERKERENA